MKYIRSREGSSGGREGVPVSRMASQIMKIFNYLALLPHQQDILLIISIFNGNMHSTVFCGLSSFFWGGPLARCYRPTFRAVMA